jgi:hypothetical protein
VWGPAWIISPGAGVWTAVGLGAALAAWAAAVLTARWTRYLAGRRIERRIGDVYELIRAKAEAARDADYAHPPLEAFALYHALREELFELSLSGGAVQALKDAVSRASAASPVPPPALPGARPVKGATVVVSQIPTALAVAADPRPNEALRAAVLEFWVYWSNRAKVEAHLRGALRNLGVDWVRRPRLAARRLAVRGD